MIRIKTRHKCKVIKVKNSNDSDRCEHIRAECLKRVSRSSSEYKKRTGRIMMNEGAHIKKCEKAYFKCKERN